MGKASAKAGARKSGKAAAKQPVTKPAAVALQAIKGGKPAAKPAAGKPAGKPDKAAKPAARIIPTAAAPDDVPVIALTLPAAKLSPAMSAYFKKCEEKLGFVPNVLLAYAFDMPSSNPSSPCTTT